MGLYCTVVELGFSYYGYSIEMIFFVIKIVKLGLSVYFYGVIYYILEL